MHIRRAFLALVLVFVVTGVSAQESRTLVFGERSLVEIDGTSNKSDWTVTASDFSGSVEMQGSAIVGASLVVQSASIKGEGGIIMNRLILDALKTAQHPEIKYTLTEVLSSAPDEGGDWVETKGTLELAGETREVRLDVLVSVEDDGRVRITGQTDISMPAYKIKPPTAMFGALHVARDVTVRIDVFAGAAEAGSGE